MKNHFRRGLLALVFVTALALASCGSSGSGGGSQGNGSGDDMEGMDHGGKAGETTSGMAGMDHDEMGHGSMEMGSGEMARQMVMENGEYSDRRFIDAMVPHHQGAVDMAEVALENAEHQEIRDLAEDIVVAQQDEIKELKAIKEQEFGTSEVPMEMSAQEMEAMGMMGPEELASQDPFDKAFIDAMIPHHRSAIEMANVAYRESDNPEIQALAETIVDAQTREIAQMTAWRKEWYPEG
jgi:uncharacterized protein (DUF305 family)